MSAEPVQAAYETVEVKLHVVQSDSSDFGEDIVLITELPNFASPVCATVDPEIFFPNKGSWTTPAIAKQICATCEHTFPCRDFAINNEIPYGVWGGTTPKERTMLRRLLDG